MSRFVTPAEVRIAISDGDHLIVKGQLNTGETLEMFARMRAKDDDTVEPTQVNLSLVLAYLLDWSLTDDSGQRVPIRGESPEVVTATLRSLTYLDFQEIVEAVQAHEVKVQAARQEKKLHTGAPPLSPHSPSLVVVGGATNG